MNKSIKGVCFGEVLFDIFPDHKEIGGAPLNVASRLHSFGVNVAMISAIGKDENGKELLNYFQKNKLSTQLIQLQSNFETGIVQVSLNEEGNASYTIKHPAAWDKIEIKTEQIEVVKTSDFLVFGSLVARDQVSKKTLLELIPNSNYKIFDINLRKPHFELSTLIELMNVADLVKMNDEELEIVSVLLKSTKKTLEEKIQFISSETNTPTICVTLGSKGAVLFKNQQFYYNTGYKIKVADTVGAGDSFLATLIVKLFSNEKPQNAIDYACAVGSLVASKKGANPSLSEKYIYNFMNQ